MENRAKLKLIINSIFIVVLVLGCHQFYKNYSIYQDLINNEGRQTWAGTLYLISWLAILGIFFGLIHFNITLKQWKEENFFDTSTVKKIEVLAAILLTIGVSLFSVEFTTINMPFREFLPAGFLGIGPMGSALIIVIGLLFSFVASVITVAKRLKDESDLTI